MRIQLCLFIPKVCGKFAFKFKTGFRNKYCRSKSDSKLWESLQALDITSQQHLRKILFFPLYFVVFSKTVSIPAIAVLTYLYSFFQPHVPHVFPGSGPEPLRLTFRQLHVYPTCPMWSRGLVQNLWGWHSDSFTYTPRAPCVPGVWSRTSGADIQTASRGPRAPPGLVHRSGPEPLGLTLNWRNVPVSWLIF